MTCDDFAALSASDKSNILYAHGSYVGKRKRGAFILVLYQIDSFYVEVYYYTYRKVIYKIKCTEQTQVLDAYLHQIDIEAIMSCLIR